MNPLQLAICVAATCGALASQSYVVSPKSDYERSEGGGLTTTFGSFAAGRYQIADGNQRGNAMTIKSLALRHDHDNYDAANGMGRDWANVKIHASEGDLATFSSTFSTNSATTPTKVFDGAVSWPIQLGVPKTVPADWALQTPFTTNFSYTGNADLLMDFDFSGGTLANKAPWSGSTAVPYALDSFAIGTSVEGPAATFGNINGGCADSGSSSTVGASMLMRATAYGPNATNTALRNKYQVEASGRNFASNTATMLVLAFGVDPAGIPFPGVTCNKIHLTSNKLWFYHPVMSSVTGNVGPYYFGWPGGAPYTPAYHGINIVTQGAWTDTKTGSLKFSSLSRNSFVTLPYEDANDVKMKTAYGPDASAATAPFTATGASANIPLLRYEK